MNGRPAAGRRRLKWLSLFSGCGGLDLGLIRAGHSVLAHAETDEAAAACYARHWPGSKNLGPVQSITPDDIPPGVNAICGGFPCQPFFAGWPPARISRQ